MTNDKKLIGSFCLWCDLLGFAQPFVESGWDLSTIASQRNILRVERLQFFFKNVLLYPLERTLVLNDGFVKIVDLVETNGQQVQYLRWFSSILDTYRYLNQLDKEFGFPGARAVLTFGYRVQYMESYVTGADIVQTSDKRKKELKHELLVYSPKEFQMNTAFSKAYIIESAGSRVGLIGSNIYIDRDFFNYLEWLLTKEDGIYYGFDMNDVPNEAGYYEGEIYKTKVKFEVNTFDEDIYKVWEVKHIIKNKKDIVFKIWLDNNPVFFDQKGIKTNLYKAVKYQAAYEKDCIFEIN